VNPFSAFLQPRNNAIQVPNTFGDLSAMAQQRKELAERTREADQHNAYNQGMLKLQQDQQSHKFADQDRSEVEGLISEYQDAVARGEPQGIENAVQKMKRFGLDVAPEAEKLPPGAVRDDKGALTTRSPFTGLPFGPQNPLNLQQAAVSDDGTPSGIRANDPNDDHELSQKEFEDRLIGDTMVDSGIENSRTDGGFQQSGSRPMPDPGDEGRNGNVMDLDQVFGDPGDAGRNGQVMDLDVAPAQVPQQAQAQPAPRGLPGMLPLIVSRQGKELYRTGGQGRWSPLVQGVFGPLAMQGDARSQAAGKKAQALAEKLAGVDGITPEQAIKVAMDAYEKDLNRGSAELRTKLGAQARGAAQKETAESIDKYGDNIEQALQHTGIPAAETKLSAAEDAIMSDDPALQKDALKMILQARSGLTVSEGERRSYQMVDGLIPFVQNTWAQWSGQPMSPETRKSLLNIIQNMRQANSGLRDAISAREVERYKAQNENKLAPKLLERRAGALGAPLSAPAKGKSEEDLY